MKLYLILLSLICATSVGAAPRSGETIRVYDCERVDMAPAFPGGDRAMLHFINSTRRYPEDALHDGVQGRVMCSFVVREDGSLGCINVLRGVHESLDREAVRIISEMPRWEAGRVGGESVAVYYVLSIPFRIY